jgi:hypothetical protein
MCVSFKIHHPYSVRNFNASDIEGDHEYFDEERTWNEISAFADETLLPVNELLAEKISGKKLRVHLKISGTLIKLVEQCRPDAMKSLKKLVALSNIHLLGQSFYNADRNHASSVEFSEHVDEHRAIIERTFHKKPVQNGCGLSSSCNMAAQYLDYRCFRTGAQVEILNQVIDAFGRYHHSIRQSHAITQSMQALDPLLKKIGSLDAMVKLVNDQSILQSWRRLQDISYHFPVRSLSLSESLKNIIADLEIHLIRKHLSKIKRKGKELPVIL